MATRTNQFSSLFRLVKNAIPDFICQQHQEQYSRITNQDLVLLCSKCQTSQKSQQLKQFFDNPVLGLFNHYSSQQPGALLEMKTMNSVKKKLKHSKSVLNNYLQSLQKTILQQCKHMRQTYQKHYQTILNRLDQNFSYLQGINKIYREQFEQNLSSFQLKDCQSIRLMIKQFITKNQDPSASLKLRMDNVKNLIRTFPYLRVQKLKELYSSVCDPMRWDINKYIDNCLETNDCLILQSNLVRLADRKHLIRYDKHQLQILENSSLKPISRIMADVDLCFQIDKFRVVTNNQKHINLYSYLNPLQLKLINSIPVKYAIQIKYQQPYIYYITDNNLCRLSLQAKQVQIVFKSNVKQYRLTDGTILVKIDKYYYSYNLQTNTKCEITKEEYYNE